MTALRKWITPLVIGSFVLMAVTGVLMFFHKAVGVNKLAHEWLSWLFLAAVALHVVTHLVSFKRYFSSPRAVAVMGLMVVVLGLSFFPLAGARTEPPQRAAMKALGRARLADLAPLARTTPDALADRLRHKWYTVASAAQTPADIAGAPDKTDAVVGEIFADSHKADNHNNRDSH